MAETAFQTDIFDPAEHPHRRFNPLSGEWVLVSPHRTQRPWQGQIQAPRRERRPAYDPECYLCPGNARAGGAKNPDYESTFVFENDFAALLPDTPTFEHADKLLRLQSVRGECRVICFSPRHDLSLAQMTLGELRTVVELWVQEQRELQGRWRWVQIFESKGALVGASNPHPHGQIWASDFLPSEAQKEDENQRRYAEAHGAPLLVEYARAEAERGGERVVAENEHWLVVVPFWAYWPFETLVLPKRHVPRLTDLSNAEKDALAQVLKPMLVKFDNLFQAPFPYCSGWHGAPSSGAAKHWQLHAHYYPPLLRSASVQKFVASYEWLAEAQRDLSPEGAAARLREQSDTHYLAGS